jgi:hypothetical protein
MRSMLSAAKKCGNRSKKRTPWSLALGMATKSIRYWDVRIKAWTKIENKAEVESHLSDRNVEQFSHAGTTPFGYTALGKEF